MINKRTYDDGCAAAHALDLVGERWALLVVRELLLGPRRFNDLHRDLNGISRNVLSQRLKELEQAGVIRRHELPPPAAARVYDLTGWGRELEPVLQQLGRWGARSPSRPVGRPVSAAALVTAMSTMFHPPAARDLHGTLGLHAGRYRYHAHVEQGTLHVLPGEPAAPNVTLSGDAPALAAVLLGGLPLAEAERDHDLRVTGDRAFAEAFRRAFRMPELAPDANDGTAGIFGAGTP